MAMVAANAAHALMEEIRRIEKGTDLRRVAVISRIGMEVANANSDQVDANAETASCSAMIDLAERLSTATNHGGLREILIKSQSGFVILQFINDEYMIFGGISNPLRVGYYMEYLRNVVHRFAYILAGNVLTDELRHEIEANRDREARLLQASKEPIAANFIMDKDSNRDVKAMKDVLSFLDDWGDVKSNPKPNAHNIVSIDNDLTFSSSDLAPQPITTDQMALAQQRPKATESKPTDLSDLLSVIDKVDKGAPKAVPQASSPTIKANLASKGIKDKAMDDILSVVESMAPSQTVSPPSTSTDSMDDIIAAIDKISQTSVQSVSTVQERKESIAVSVPSSSSPAVPIAPASDGVLSDEILADLNEFSTLTSTSSVGKVKKTVSDTVYPYGVPIYENEVPPVPLDDYVSFEIGSLTAATHSTPEVSPNTMSQSVHPTAVYSTPSKEIKSQAPSLITSPPAEERKIQGAKDESMTFAAEYDDADLRSEEDAMRKALTELDKGSNTGQKDKKKK